MATTAIAAAGGVTVRTEGDSFFAVFVPDPEAVAAAVAAQRALVSHEFGADIDLRVGWDCIPGLVLGRR